MNAQTDSGRKLFSGPSGRWAGEQLLKALNAGEPMGPQALRTLDTLRKNEWEYLDEVLVEEAMIRLVGIADLKAMGLTQRVPNAMGRTMLQWEEMTDLNPAITSLSGIDRSDNDRPDFAINNLPFPITHKDWDLSLRHLAASRNPPGEPLDTTMVRVSGRLVAERQEYMLFNGGGTYGGSEIYGYLTHPNRNHVQFGTSGELWNVAGHDGNDILTDVLNGIAALEADRMYGPYMIYVPSNFNNKLDEDFKANGDLTIRQRLMQISTVRGIKCADQLPASKVVIVQMTSDVVKLYEGEPLQTVQWDIEGGFIIKMKAFVLEIHRIAADAADRCGICVLDASA